MEVVVDVDGRSDVPRNGIVEVYSVYWYTQYWLISVAIVKSDFKNWVWSILQNLDQRQIPKMSVCGCIGSRLFALPQAITKQLP